MRIRNFEIEDVCEIARLTTQLGYPTSIEKSLPRLQRLQSNPDHRLFVADDEKAGVIAWIHLRIDLTLASDPKVEVVGLVVDEKWRGKGIGKILMREAEKYARGLGYKVIRLRTNVVRDGAHKFYETLGYALKKTSHMFLRELE
jgi:GNAT superfamily N-acetyltransferase